MELDIDPALAAQYRERHDFYSRNLNVFRSVIRVFEVYFKKDKFQNAEIKIDDDAKNRATLKFCGKKYRFSLVVDPGEPGSASIVLLKTSKDQLLKIGEAAIADAENIVFPGEKRVSLRDSYEFNNAVLNFFITAVTKQRA